MTLQALIVLIAGFCIGVGVETISNQNGYVSIWLLGLALAVALLWRRAPSSCPRLYLFPLFLIFVSLGLLRTEFYEQQFNQSLHHLLSTEVDLIGEVVRDPDRRTTMQLLFVSYGDQTILVSTDQTLAVSYGDTVRVIGELEVPESFETDLGRTFDYRGYLAAKRVAYRVSFAEVSVLSEADPSIVGSLLTMKQSFMDALDRVLAEPEGSLADGLLLGLNRGLGDQLEEDFRRSGIIHIVVLSGYNIMLVVAFVMFVLSFFVRERIRLIFGLLAIVNFALIVGLSATVVRASIMAGLLLIAQTFRRSYDVLRALLLAGLVMLVINPYLLLYDIGFQLSFMATLGLIAALPLFDAAEQPEFITSVRGYVVATVATQIAVLPLLIYHIGEVSVVAVVVNVLILPAVPFAMLGSFLAGVTAYLSISIGLLLGYVTSLLLKYIIFVAEVFASLPLATITFPEISAWLIFVLYAIFTYGYWLLFFRTKHEDLLKGWVIEEEA